MPALVRLFTPSKVVAPRGRFIASTISPSVTSSQRQITFAYKGFFLISASFSSLEASAMLFTPSRLEIKFSFFDKDKSFAKVIKGNVIIDCVKEAEDDDSVILRLFEPFGSRGNVSIELAKDIKLCEETNLLEERIESDFNINKNVLSFYIKPFEIKTFKIN